MKLTKEQIENGWSLTVEKDYIMILKHGRLMIILELDASKEVIDYFIEKVDAKDRDR